MDSLILGIVATIFGIGAVVLAILYFRARRDLAATDRELEAALNRKEVAAGAIHVHAPAPDLSYADAIRRANHQAAKARSEHNVTIDTLAVLWKPEVDKNLERKPTQWIGHGFGGDRRRTSSDAVQEILASIRAGQEAIARAVVESEHIAIANRFRLPTP